MTQPLLLPANILAALKEAKTADELNESSSYPKIYSASATTGTTPSKAGDILSLQAAMFIFQKLQLLILIG